MANTILLKQTSTPSKVPTTSDLALGECCINTYDGKLFLKKDDGTPSIVEIGSGGGGSGVSYSTGMMMMFAGATAPSGWLICDGTAVSRTTYSVLFGVIGTAYGTGDGSTTFNLPDLSRRIPMGKGASDTLGGSDGVAYASRAVTHSHSVPAHYHGMGTGADLNITSSGGTTTGIESANHSHSGTTGYYNSGNGANTGTESVWHQHAGTTDAGGSHTHTIPGTTASTQNASGEFYRSSAGTADYSLGGGAHTHTMTTGNQSVLHTHPVADHTHPFSSGTQSANHTHTAPNHTHAAANIAGSIGLVTGGVNGNAAMTSGSVTQPYVFVNHIIKI